MSDERNPYRLFVTHAWSEDDEYLRVFEYLESNRNFYYRNLSLPGARPPGGREQEMNALKAQIDGAELVIALAAQYASSPFLIEFEATYARATRRPVLVLSPFGVTAEPPPALSALAAQSLGWNERTLIDAIKRHARHVDTPRYATIDFTPP